MKYKRSFFLPVLFVFFVSFPIICASWISGESWFGAVVWGQEVSETAESADSVDSLNLSPALESTQAAESTGTAEPTESSEPAPSGAVEAAEASSVQEGADLLSGTAPVAEGESGDVFAETKSEAVAEEPGTGSEKETVNSGKAATGKANEVAEKAAPSEPKPMHQRASTEVVFELSDKDKAAISALSDKLVELNSRSALLKASIECYDQEIKQVEAAAELSSPFHLFLSDIGYFKKIQKQPSLVFSNLLQSELAPISNQMQTSQGQFERRIEQMQKGWRDLHKLRCESESLQFELESGRKIVAQLASLLSMDKRWFWLFGLISFTVLWAVSLHDKRHEIRRWLNGGRARSMRLSKILAGTVVFLASATFVTFIFGDQIYRALLDVGVAGVPPKIQYEQTVAQLEKDVVKQKTELEKRIISLREAQKKLQSVFVEMAPGGDELFSQFARYRKAALDNAIAFKHLSALASWFQEDRNTMNDLYNRVDAYSQEVTMYLRFKHLIRVGLGLGLLVCLGLGMFAFFNGVMAQQRNIRNTCPLCLAQGELERITTVERFFEIAGTCKVEPGDFEVPTKAAPIIHCQHETSKEPVTHCNYVFSGQYQSFPKLSIPTLGIPQAGKTFWLTMLYWQLSNGYTTQSKSMQIIPSPVTRDLDRAVNDLLNTRMGLPATQRDRVPHPVVFDYRDRDKWGQSRILANVFDYSGEITTDAASDDYRRKRALESDAFLFFLDPTFPWEPQAEALERFNADVRNLRHVKSWSSLRLPIALCLTKIDLLPTLKQWPNSWHKANDFYTKMAQIDPTGEAISHAIIDQRSVLTDELRRDIWPDWDLDGQVKKLFGGRHAFFPMTAVGLEGSGETDLAARTLSPFGLCEPLFWVMEMNGYPTL